PIRELSPPARIKLAICLVVSIISAAQEQRRVLPVREKIPIVVNMSVDVARPCSSPVVIVKARDLVRGRLIYPANLDMPSVSTEARSPYTNSNHFGMLSAVAKCPASIDLFEKGDVFLVAAGRKFAFRGSWERRTCGLDPPVRYTEYLFILSKHVFQLLVRGSVTV